MSAGTLDIDAVLAFPLTGTRLIEASAGTGKTYTIANLVLRHVVEGRRVGEILVVTFTVAATDELRGRIRARLAQALDLLERGGAPEDPFLAALAERERAAGRAVRTARQLRLAVRTMDEAAIYTIHGFCQRALTDYAFNSGQQFQMEVLADDSALRREALRDWWRRTTYPLDPARSRFLVDALVDPDTFGAWLAPLLGHQAQRLLPAPEPLDEVLARLGALAPELEAVAQEWRREGARLQGILRESKGLSRAQAGPYHEARLAPALAILDGYFAGEDLLPPPEAFAVLSAATLARHRLKTADPDLEDSFFARCAGICEALDRLRRDLQVAALADAAAWVRARVRESKRKAQVLAFDDLLLEMHGALQGANGEAFAGALREQFPVALIDEFQDTDPVQYGIFRRIYHDREGCGLILIGDPKQAIYSFRGGDIFTYMQARADVGPDARHTLGTNWRSTPEVIQAVNAVFGGRDDAFVYGETIPFQPVAPADKAHRRLVRGGAPQAALTLWRLPVDADRKGGEKAISKQRAEALSHGAVADEIARLVREGRAGQARLGERALAPGDVAVLVRTSREAAELRAVLAARGVDAVAVAREGVYASPEAAALEMLLQAVIEPRDRPRARLALASPLLGLDAAAIAHATASEAAWIEWMDRLLALQETWLRRGFMAMFQRLLRELGIARALARGPLAERRLTNLLHLGELLQQASKAHGGMDALLHWYRLQRESAAAEEAELRLESDAELVQIVTVHASKGLEYPVVFVPYLWGCRVRDDADMLAFHQDREACLDAGSDRHEEHLRLAEQERLAEDVRLAYVALTRAESALYLVWGRAGSRGGHAGRTALGWLLHPHQPAAALAEELPDAFATCGSLDGDLERLARAAPGAIAVAPMPEPEAATVVPVAAAPPVLAPRRFQGRIAADWRVSSFSALTRDVHAAASAPPRDEGAADVGLRFPAGSHVGSYLHLLLEKLDFGGDVAAQVGALAPELAPRFGLDAGRWGGDTAALLSRAVRTPLDGDGLALASLGAAQRLNELEFDFATGPVDPAALDQLLAAAAARRGADGAAPLTVESFQGMVNGIVDLVFEHRGRYFVADYKSNFLGGSLEDYGPDRLRAAVLERRYDLQYLLYTLALHRYLRGRLPGYVYERHFGGVYYLFLRGMRPETGPECGVHFDRPDPDLLKALDRDVFPHPGGGPA